MIQTLLDFAIFGRGRSWNLGIIFDITPTLCTSIFCRPRSYPRLGTKEEDSLRRGLRPSRGNRLDELQQRPGRVQVCWGSEGFPVARRTGRASRAGMNFSLSLIMNLLILLMAFFDFNMVNCYKGLVKCSLPSVRELALQLRGGFTQSWNRTFPDP